MYRKWKYGRISEEDRELIPKYEEDKGIIGQYQGVLVQNDTLKWFQAEKSSQPKEMMLLMRTICVHKKYNGLPHE